MSQYRLDFTKEESSLISAVDYDDETEEITLWFHKYYTDKLTYGNFKMKYFESFCEVRSKGRYYLNFLKTNFKLKHQTMAEGKKNKPKGINKASDKKRFIKMRLNVAMVNREFFIQGEKGTYMDITLQMLPDGLVDSYENLGMITQDVPKEVYEREKKLPANQKSQGAILGNGKELLWENSGAEGGVGADGASFEGMSPEDIAVLTGDLPF